MHTPAEVAAKAKSWWLHVQGLAHYVHWLSNVASFTGYCRSCTPLIIAIASSCRVTNTQALQHPASAGADAAAVHLALQSHAAPLASMQVCSRCHPLCTLGGATNGPARAWQALPESSRAGHCCVEVRSSGYRVGRGGQARAACSRQCCQAPEHPRGTCTAAERRQASSQPTICTHLHMPRPSCKPAVPALHDGRHTHHDGVIGTPVCRSTQALLIRPSAATHQHAPVRKTKVKCPEVQRYNVLDLIRTA
jgi:hypothetical protein